MASLLKLPGINRIIWSLSDMADTNGVTLYTTEPCGFCRQAKNLLEARRVSYKEVNLAKDPVGRAELVSVTGQMTFPQVVVGERSIGGVRGGGAAWAGSGSGSRRIAPGCSPPCWLPSARPRLAALAHVRPPPRRPQLSD